MVGLQCAPKTMCLPFLWFLRFSIIFIFDFAVSNPFREAQFYKTGTVAVRDWNRLEVFSLCVAK